VRDSQVMKSPDLCGQAVEQALLGGPDDLLIWMQ